MRNTSLKDAGKDAGLSHDKPQNREDTELVWLDEPYRHTIGRGYFDDELYLEMLARLPDDKDYVAYPSYPGRNIYPIKSGFWADIAGLVKRGKHARVQLVRDYPGYFITPHTDSQKDTCTILFYLTDKERETGGTSVFVPKDKEFKSNGHGNFPFKDFNLIKTAPYVPNGYYGHYRSDVSFHGVYPVEFTRNILQVNFY